MASKERVAQARARRASERRADSRKRTMLRAGIVVMAIVALAAVPTWAFSRPGRRVASQGRDHIPVGTSHRVAYTTTPPTSGPHYDPSAGPGVYDEPMPDGYLIHSLEHGYVIISHDLSDLPPDEAEQTLAKLVRIADADEFWKLIVIPRPGMSQRFALTAWQRIDTFDELDERRIRRFISAWRDKGPEHTPN